MSRAFSGVSKDLISSGLYNHNDHPKDLSQLSSIFVVSTKVLNIQSYEKKEVWKLVLSVSSDVCL